MPNIKYPEVIKEANFQLLDNTAKDAVSVFIKDLADAHSIDNPDEFARNSANIEQFEKDIFTFSNILHDTNKDGFSFQADPMPKGELDVFLKGIDPNYQGATPEKMEQNRVYQEKFMKKLSTLSLENALVEKVANVNRLDKNGNTMEQIPRPLNAMFYTPPTRENFEKNRKIRETLTEGTPTEKRDLIMNRLNEMCNVDLSGIDIHDKEQMYEHLDTLYPISQYGDELINLVNAAKEYGVNFGDENNRELLEKAQMMNSVGTFVREKINTVSSPLYAQADLDSLNLSDLPKRLTVDRTNQRIVPPGEQPPQNARVSKCGSLNEAMADMNFDMTRPATFVCLKQMEVQEAILKNEMKNPVFDNSLSPEQRQEAFHGYFANSENSQFKNVDLPQNKIENDKVVPMSQEEIREQEIIARRAEIHANVAEIRKVIPDFEFTEKDMQDMLSPERDEMFNKVQAVVDRDNERHDFIKEQMDTSQFLAQRFVHDMLPDAGMPNAEQERKKVAELLNAPTAEGQDMRRKAIADNFAKLNDLDINAFDPHNVNNTLSAQVDYAVKNFNTFSFMEDIGALTRGLKDNGHLKFSPELQEQYDNQKDLIEEVGHFGSGVLEPFKHPKELRNFPFEKLTPEQGMLIMGAGFSSDGPLSPQVRAAGSFFTANAAKKDFFEEKLNKVIPERIELDIDAENVVDTPDVEKMMFRDMHQLGKNLATEYEKLKNADNFFNLNNSKAYKDMLKGLEQTGKVLKEIGDGKNITDDQQKRLRDSLLQVHQSSLTYRNEKQQLLNKGETFNENRQKRFDIAKDLLAMTDVLVQPGERQNDRHFRELMKANARANDPNLQKRKELKNRKEYDEIAKANADVTVELIQRVKGMEAPNSNTPAGERFVNRKLLDARMELIENMVSKKFEPQAARASMEKMILCQNMLQEKKIPDNIDEAQFNAQLQEREIAERRKLPRDITPDKVNRFLAKRGDEVIAQKVTEERRSALVNEHLNERTKDFQLKRIPGSDERMNPVQAAMTEMYLTSAKKLINEMKRNGADQVKVKENMLNMAFAAAHMNDQRMPNQMEVSAWKKDRLFEQNKVFSKEEITDAVLDEGKELAQQLNAPNKQKQNAL